ncbi:MAG TPA: serine O-acetyltransferase [Dehalococcoidia bacterium]|nr:serine O-acetyltransferase [Dehalococcoidia bacterium]
MGWLSAIREDIGAAQTRDPAARNSIEVLLTYPGVHALIIHRLAHALWLADIPLLPRLISNLSRLLTGIEIHPGAIMGHRLFIDHGMGVVIGETTVIGDDCHLFQGVTLGGTSTRHEKRHPTLENNVVVGAGAKIVGAVIVGENSRIGAGSVVASNVPPNATVVGVPGHVIAFRDESNDTIQRLPDPEWDRIDSLERRLQQIEQQLAKGSITDASTARSTDAPDIAAAERDDR